MGYLRKMRGKKQQSKAHTFIDMNHLSRNPGCATVAYLFYLFVYGNDIILLSKLDILRPRLHCMSKTAWLSHSMIITAIPTGSQTQLATECTVSNMTGPKKYYIFRWNESKTSKQVLKYVG